MCISARPAAFSGTRILASKARHAAHGVIDVLGYQNVARNASDGPNAMLLHIPAADPMSPRNFVDVSRCPGFLRDIEKSVLPPPPVRRSRGPLRSFAVPKGAFMVFDHGVYTVVLADCARVLPEALERVDERKRPTIGEDLAAFYDESFPNWVIALCCFDGTDAKKADPITLWYRSMFSDLLFAPGLDAHTGGPPDLRDAVDVDHMVFFAEESLDEIGTDIRYGTLSTEATPFLPKRAIGDRFGGELRNGDFVLDLTKSVNRRNVAQAVERYQPREFPKAVAA